MGQQPEILLCLRIFKDALAVNICASLWAGDYVDNHTQKHQRKTKSFHRKPGISFDVSDGNFLNRL